MKKTLSLLFVLLILLSGCSTKKKEIHDPVNYYYLVSSIRHDHNSSVITCEVRDKFGHANDYTYLIEDYLLGPQSPNSTSPFPAGTTLIRFDLMKDTALVDVSSHLALLSGHDLTLACACLGKTVLELTGMKSVQITAQGDLLDGKEFITVDAGSLALIDNYVP